MPVYDMHSFSDACLFCAASSLAPNSGAVSEPSYQLTLFSFGSCQHAAGNHGVRVSQVPLADLCRCPSPRLWLLLWMAAGLSGLTGLMMFLQPLTWQTIANRNEPAATGARSASGLWCIRQAGIWLLLRDINTKQKATQIEAVSVPSLSTSPRRHSYNGLNLFFFACVNRMKQSRGININAVITALRATQNQDNSRRLASGEKKKILITLASAFLLNGQHAEACHLCLESKDLSLLLPFIPLDITYKKDAWIIQNWDVFVTDLMVVVISVTSLTTRGKPLLWCKSLNSG